MKRLVAVGLMTMLCGGCGGYNSTYFGIAMIDAAVGGVKARDKKRTVNADWLTEKTDDPVPTFHPTESEAVETVKSAKPTPEQMQQMKEVIEKVKAQQVQAYEQKRLQQVQATKAQ